MTNEEDEVLPINNGFELDTYKWTQNHKDIVITIPISDSIKSKDIQIVFKPNALKVKVKESTIIDGDLFSNIKVENSMWLIDDTELVIEMDKKKFDEWWKCAIIGEPKINLSKIITGQGSLDDLDQSTRMTIDKMLYDQKMKENNKLI